jgi:formylglycine-generating enzyme required for sulfatase activity
MTRLGSSRRNRDSGFQWLIIGIVLGMGCAMSFGLALYVFDVITISTGDEATATAEVVQAATDSTNNDIITEEANNGDQTEDATQSTPDGATDSTNNDQVDDSSNTQSSPPAAPITPTPLPGGSGSPESGTGLSTENPSTPVSSPVDNSTAISLPQSDQIPEGLTFIVSNLAIVDSGTFRMGTTQDEGLSAVAECSTRDATDCPASDVADSIPPHDVTLDPFRMEIFEVSVSQYVAFLNYLVDQNPGTRPHLSACNGPCILARDDNGGEYSDVRYNADTMRYEVFEVGFNRSNFPITYVFWEGAQAYCRAIGRKLPTEAQWERAARGPNNTIYPWGQQWDPTAANTTRSGDTRLGFGGTLQVDTFPNGASAYGPLNMAGNVAEWTSDWYSPTIYQERANSGQTAFNPTGPDLGDQRVVRGGSWDAVPLYARTVHRQSESPGKPGAWIGFRCAADPDPLASTSNTPLTQPIVNTPTLSPTLDPNQ